MVCVCVYVCCLPLLLTVITNMFIGWYNPTPSVFILNSCNYNYLFRVVDFPLLNHPLPIFVFILLLILFGFQYFIVQ
eukprot:m.23131 g.23131  ORF g.23131 m.23131 type:complete len:77 (+) comp5522_c0_seq1:235-465(+)